MANCRICLCSRPRKDFSDINIVENGETRSYKDVLNFCLEIQISDDPNTNTRLCVKCYRKIIDFYEFKALALRNDENTSNLFTNTLETNGIFLPEEANSEDVLDEPLVFCDENSIVDSTEIKIELKLENESDDEMLSVIKHLKEEKLTFIEDNDITSTNTNDKMKSESKFNEEEIFKENKEIRKSKKTKQNKKIEGICEQCGKHVKNIHEHRNLHLPVEKRKVFPCEYCEKTFKAYSGRRKHIQRKHLNVKKECNLCGKAVYDMNMHIQTTHNPDALKFECIHCKKRFLTQPRLNLHLSVHTKDRPFECDQCGACFRLNLTLNNHKRQVHDKERSHQCHLCARSFFKKDHLKIHIRSHTNERPYSCPECGKRFQSTRILKVHRLRHTNVKTVECTLCDATFYSRSNLHSHMVSHTKEKRHPCRYCEAKFHRSDHRKRHEYTAHLKNGLLIPRNE